MKQIIGYNREAKIVQDTANAQFLYNYRVLICDQKRLIVTHCNKDQKNVQMFT